MSRIAWPDGLKGLRWAHRPGFPYREGNALILLENGAEILAATRSLIQSARHRLDFEMYIWADDPVGRDLARLLKAAHDRGVRIRGVVDGFGSWGGLGLVRELQAAGLELRIYHPPSLFNSFRVWNRRNHRKLLLRDEEEAMVGSANWALDYAPDWNPAGFLDLGLQVRGPVVRDLREDFERAWAKVGGPSEPVGSEPPLAPPPGWLQEVPIQIISSLGRVGPAAFSRHARRMLAQARKEILLLHAYFVPSPRILSRLVRAARRGLCITVVVPGHTDQPFVQAAGRHAYGRLLAAGVRIWERQGRMLHAKVAVVDRAWVSLGSANLDARSAGYNLELNLHLHAPALAARLAELAAGEMAESQPCDPGIWGARPWWQRWGQRIAWSFRSWL